jgi:Uri superfamily endonuclease
MPIKGNYCLCINNYKDQFIKIGALGKIEFKKGLYIYIGSAFNSLLPRLERHLKTSQGKHHVFHWHIDYFLREETVEISSIYIKEMATNIECKIAEEISNHGSPIVGFGSSDCNCKSHLYNVTGFKFLEKMGMKKWY